MKLNDKTYAWIKWLVVIVLPACGTLWTGLSKIWPLPYAAEIPATIMVVCTFLGAVLCISTAEYYRMEDSTEGKHETGTAAIYGLGAGDQNGRIPDPETGGTATLDEIIADLKDVD